ncbi:hypothetical protein, partial [Carboxylicivirga linearis]
MNDSGWIQCPLSSGTLLGSNWVYARQKGNHVVISGLFSPTSSPLIWDLPEEITPPSINIGCTAVNAAFNLAQMAILSGDPRILVNQIQAVSGQYAFNMSYYTGA